jgi:hypothetical protein
MALRNRKVKDPIAEEESRLLALLDNPKKTLVYAQYFGNSKTAQNTKITEIDRGKLMYNLFKMDLQLHI